MAIKKYSPELKPHYQVQFSVIPMTPLFGGGGSLTSAGEKVSIM